MPGCGGNNPRNLNGLERATLPLYSFPVLRNRSGYIHLGLFDGVDELYPAGQQADASVRVGALGAVLEVSLDGTAHVGELAANLVVPSGKELDFQKEIAVGGLDEGILKLGLLAVFGYVRLVLGLVSYQIVYEDI